MQYARSGTILDQVSDFMPQKLLNLGRFSSVRGMRAAHPTNPRFPGTPTRRPVIQTAKGMRGMRGMGAMGDFMDDYISLDFGGADVSGMSDSSSYDPSSYWPTDPSNSYPTDASYYPPAPYIPAPAGPSPTLSPSSNTAFNWSQIPAIFRDTFNLYNQATAQKQIQDINVARARAGQPPINSAAYAPGVSVGLNAQAQQMLGMSLGTLVLAGAAGVYFLTRRPSRRSRR